MATVGTHNAFAIFRSDGFIEEEGLTKREYFAAQIAAGISASDIEDKMKAEHIAKGAVVVADALIAELNKPVKS